MPFPKEYPSLLDLARVNLALTEGAKTSMLLHRVRGEIDSKDVNRVFRATFDVAVWKSPRRIDLILSGDPRVALSAWEAVAQHATNPAEQVKALGKIRGVAVPMASALLMMWDAHRHAVIDRFIVEVFQAYGELTSTKKTGIRVVDYVSFITIIRDMARTLKVTCRQVELSLYESFLAYQFDQTASSKFRTSAS